METKHSEQIDNADSIMFELGKLRATAQGIVDRAEKERPAVAVMALRELRGLLSLHADLEGRLWQRRKVEVTGRIEMEAGAAVRKYEALVSYTTDFIRRRIPDLIDDYLDGLPEEIEAGAPARLDAAEPRRIVPLRLDNGGMGNEAEN